MAADYFVRFAGDLSDADREALDRPDFRLYEGGREAPASVDVGQPPDEAPRHLIRVSARAPEDAHRALVSTLGREPAELEVVFTVDP